MNRTILIGASRVQKLPALVSEYSIITRTTSHPRIIHTWNEKAPEPKKPEHRSRTGFSFQRFTLPRRTDYEGVGVYLDSDMILLADIKELFEHVEASRSALHCTKNLPAVIAMNCEKELWDVDAIFASLDAGLTSYKDLMHLEQMKPMRSIDDLWNCLDEAPKGARVVHYTDMSRQCWRVKDARPVSNIWKNELRSAVETGFIDPDVIDEEIRKGYVIPQVKIDAGLE